MGGTEGVGRLLASELETGHSPGVLRTLDRLAREGKKARIWVRGGKIVGVMTAQ